MILTPSKENFSEGDKGKGTGIKRNLIHKIIPGQKGVKKIRKGLFHLIHRPYCYYY